MCESFFSPLSHKLEYAFITYRLYHIKVEKILFYNNNSFNLICGYSSTLTFESDCKATVYLL